MTSRRITILAGLMVAASAVMQAQPFDAAQGAPSKVEGQQPAPQVQPPAQSNDPRVGLKPGIDDAGVAAA